MKENSLIYGKTITAGSMRRLVLALLCTIFIGITITQWGIQTIEPPQKWGHYTLYATLIICLALPGLYLFKVRPMTFLINRLNKAERTAYITAKYLNSVISSSSVILFSMRIVDEHMYPEWVSCDNLKNLLGYSEEEAMQADWWLANLHDQDRDQVVAASSRLFQGETVVCEYRFKHKNGNEIWIHDEQKLISYKDGKPTHAVCMWYDISKQKKADQELRIAAHAFDLHEGIMVTDAGNLIQRINPAFTQITGYSEKEIVGESLCVLQADRQDTHIYDAIWEAVQRNGYWDGELWSKRKNGDIYLEWLSITAIKDDKGRITNHIGIFCDITDKDGVEERIRILAFYDPLTKLANRRLLQDRIGQAIAASARCRQHGAMLFLDLDRFKILNDTYGHNMGDQLLLEVAQRLRANVREGDTIARLGGDEFVIVINSLDKYAAKAGNQAMKLAENLREILSKPYQLAVTLNQSQVAITYHSSASIGVVLFLGHSSSTEELMKYADLAMYEAKRSGRNAVSIFDPGMQTDIIARANLEADMRIGLQEKQFLLHYQPQVNADGQLMGSEALVRWQHPVLGMVSPADFIPLAEESGLILHLGLWVLETACTQLAVWNKQQKTTNLTVAVNVSAHQFRQDDFVNQVLTVLERTGANPKNLKLELTESMLVHDVESIIGKMSILKEKGVGFALDDFGTGYSSLSYLKRLPLDQLKIDQGFVRDILEDANDAAISKMIVALAESMGLDVIAEGVETDEQRHFLAGQGCYAYQGYLFSRPLALEMFNEFIGQF